MTTAAGGRFRHEALFYAGEGYLGPAVAFIRDGLAAGDPILVVVGGEKIARLRAELGADAARVRFEDMAALGRNPARLIPAWRSLVELHRGEGGRVRGIGEVFGISRDVDELAECHVHEALLDLAFDDTDRFWLLCPYDVAALGRDTLARAAASHSHAASARVGDTAGARRRLDPAGVIGDPLGPVPTCAERLEFSTLPPVRRLVAACTTAAGLGPDATVDAVTAVNEVAANSLRHGGGHGTLDVWKGGAGVVCQVSDEGRVVDPMVGRRAPGPRDLGGRGLWLANQLCRLVQIRSSEQGTTVRLHIGDGAPGRHGRFAELPGG
jgi:anti-sigma regulatory factor (Ser/Thr protein kinase)